VPPAQAEALALSLRLVSERLTQQEKELGLMKETLRQVNYALNGLLCVMHARLERGASGANFATTECSNQEYVGEYGKIRIDIPFAPNDLLSRDAIWDMQQEAFDAGHRQALKGKDWGKDPYKGKGKATLQPPIGGKGQPPPQLPQAHAPVERAKAKEKKEVNLQADKELEQVTDEGNFKVGMQGPFGPIQDLNWYRMTQENYDHYCKNIIAHVHNLSSEEAVAACGVTLVEGDHANFEGHLMPEIECGLCRQVPIEGVAHILGWRHRSANNLR